MLVSDVMSRRVATVSPSACLQDALDLMVKHHIGSVIVTEEGKALGILTERDIMVRVFHKRLDPQKVTVHSVMSSPLTVIDKLAKTEKAAELMNKKNIKKLGVTSNGILVGVVTITDLVRKQPQMIKQLRDTWTKIRWQD